MDTYTTLYNNVSHENIPYRRNTILEHPIYITIIIILSILMLIEVLQVNYVENLNTFAPITTSARYIAYNSSNLPIGTYIILCIFDINRCIMIF